MNQHWTQVASKANIKWLKTQIQKQQSDELSLTRLCSYALMNRGISKEKFFVYLEALQASGFITVDLKTETVHKLQLEVESFKSQSKL